MPIGEWFKDELADEFRETVTAVDIDAFAVRDVLAAFEEHREGGGEHGKFLWSVYVFSRWYRRLEDAGTI
jgi:asparagine synthase (glutamine-hydrolysing)